MASKLFWIEPHIQLPTSNTFYKSFKHMRKFDFTVRELILLSYKKSNIILDVSLVISSRFDDKRLLE